MLITINAVGNFRNPNIKRLTWTNSKEVILQGMRGCKLNHFNNFNFKPPDRHYSSFFAVKHKTVGKSQKRLQ